VNVSTSIKLLNMETKEGNSGRLRGIIEPTGLSFFHNVAYSIYDVHVFLL